MFQQLNDSFARGLAANHPKGKTDTPLLLRHTEEEQLLRNTGVYTDVYI